MTTWQTPRPFIPGYRKLADFVQPQKCDLPQTQELSVLPRMKLPARDVPTGEMVVPWVTVWSGKAETLPIETCKGTEQASMRTSLPETLCDIATVRLSTPQYSEATIQATGCISTFVFTENGERETAQNRSVKKQTNSIWKYIGAILPRFRTRIFAPVLAKGSQSSAKSLAIRQKKGDI